MSEAPMVGKLADENAKRDCIHVALAPVVAGEELEPGERIGMTFDGIANRVTKTIGIVDPFLAESVKPGQRFFMFLLPNTITSLRHVFEHPAFTYTPGKS
jgi:hypothetical protein